MSHDDPGKWALPGWRIEQRFAPGCLIGNWSEERHQFQKGNYNNNSTHRTDFKNYNTFRPDVVLRRKAMLKNDGLGPEKLFHHHGKSYSNNMISWYDEHYNRRPREEFDRLPELRHWDSHQLAWVPERSDYPMRGGATKFSLLDKKKALWSSQIADETRGDYMTTYTVSYHCDPRRGCFDTRYATPKEHSTNLLNVNKTNKDLHFRNSVALRNPESLPTVMPASAVHA